jgi:molybdate transport system substrate-binding protein
LNAPYGLAAEECLKFYGKYEAVSSKLVFGESVAQTNQFIVSKAVELGFTAKSVVLSPQMKGQGRWIEMDQATYLPIAQGAIVVKRKDKSQTQAIKFYEFLFSPKAQNILIDNGYAIQL